MMPNPFSEPSNRAKAQTKAASFAVGITMCVALDFACLARSLLCLWVGVKFRPARGGVGRPGQAAAIRLDLPKTDVVQWGGSVVSELLGFTTFVV